MTRRIGGVGGGSDPGSGGGKNGQFVTAAVLAGVVAAAGGGGLGSGATASVGEALDSAAASRADAKPASSENPAKKRNDAETWRRLGLRKVNEATKRHLRCAIQSHGQVQQFFLRAPCNSLDQRLLAFVDTHGNVVVVSVVWVKMPSADSASQLRQLEDAYGTGDVTPLPTEVLQLGGIRFTGKHFMSRQDGPLLVIAETEPVRGQPSTTLLNDLARIAAVLPPP